MRFKVASRVRGLSDEAFREAFGTEEQCRAALLRLRWPDGFVCPCCGHRGHCVLAGRGLYQCNRCKKQTSPTAGTIFHATKLPLTLWFAAIHLIVTAKNGISSVELGRRLGVKQPTAWAVKHKIMAVMARREGETPLTGRVEMDDAYLGGVRSGGKRGRGAAGKTPFVAAVSTSPEGRPRKLKLVPVKGFRKREIARGAKHWLAPGAAVVTHIYGGVKDRRDVLANLPVQIRNESADTLSPISYVYLFTKKGIPVVPGKTTSNILSSRTTIPGKSKLIPLESLLAHEMDAPDDLIEQYRLPISVPSLPPGAVEKTKLL